jgi:hypothetical protein
LLETNFQNNGCKYLIREDRPLETYILRIYRREKGIPHRIIGIIEESGVEGKKAFTCLDELWGILNPAPARKLPSKKKKDPGAIEDHCSNPVV